MCIEIFQLSVALLTEVTAELHAEMDAFDMPLEAQVTTEDLPTIHTTPLRRENKGNTPGDNSYYTDMAAWCQSAGGSWQIQSTLMPNVDSRSV